MVSFINSKMVVIGVTCLKTYHLTLRYFGIYLHWRAEGVIDEIMDTLHQQVRKRVKKNLSGQH